MKSLMRWSTRQAWSYDGYWKLDRSLVVTRLIDFGSEHGNTAGKSGSWIRSVQLTKVTLPLDM